MSDTKSSLENLKSKEVIQQNRQVQRSHSRKKEKKHKNKDLVTQPQDEIGWYDEAYLTLIFNSFSLADIQKVLMLQERPDGIPKGWHVGFCARRGCKANVEENMTDSGWCGDHFGPGVAPLPLDRVKRILIHELLIRTDSRAKLQEVVKASNGVFLVRDAIEELLAVVAGDSERASHQESSENQQKMIPVASDQITTAETILPAATKPEGMTETEATRVSDDRLNDRPSNFLSFVLKAKASWYS